MGDPHHAHTPSNGALGVHLVDLEGHHLMLNRGFRLRAETGLEHDLVAEKAVVHRQDGRQTLARDGDTTDAPDVQQFETLVSSQFDQPVSVEVLHEAIIAQDRADAAGPMVPFLWSRSCPERSGPSAGGTGPNDPPASASAG
ncbi:MAG TPA: hypothetical protein VHA73_12245 [Acidimicrobiales bacterium]|nr:hypothetical protein [Acidimicrobiales bacterium]